MNNKIVFITGGARSGKSTFVLNEANKIKGPRAYIATAEALDKEMKERIERHKKDRSARLVSEGDEWNTYEEPLEITTVLSDAKKKHKVVVIDCLTLWLSNLMHKSSCPIDSINEFINILASLSSSNRLNGLNGFTLFIVSNEVGMGIVPDNELAREFRDLAGALNQKVAEAADEVYLVTAGIPLKIKSRK